jgi:hypothetical protein
MRLRTIAKELSAYAVEEMDNALSVYFWNEPAFAVEISFFTGMP